MESPPQPHGYKRKYPKSTSLWQLLDQHVTSTFQTSNGSTSYTSLIHTLPVTAAMGYV